jgi:UDP-2-acetamido-2-deoxy-ribo-hexuluronate aminotransferase
VKNLVFDVNVVLDLWLERQPEERLLQIASLIDCRRAGTALGWIASPSLHVLEYLAHRQFKHEGIDPTEAKQTVKQLLFKLAQQLRPLSAFGYQQDIALLAHTDLEDAQLVAAARVLHGPTAIVTNDKRFATAGSDLVQLGPDEAIHWLRQSRPSDSLDFVDLKTQQDAIRPQLEQLLHRVLHHGQYILGPEVRELESRLQTYTGAKHCITVASGTEALLISLMALGIGPGDEVITTPFTFVATVEVIVLLGATPVFVDIEPDTCNIDATLIAARITEKTKAIMPVGLYGQPADMDAVNAVAARHGDIPVIEDAAQSFGAEYRGRKSCHLSTIGCTSFFPSKPLGCYGDGGAIFTDDDALAQACREIRVHGQSKRYVHTRVGVGGRMDTLQCAVVLAKLDRFDQEIAQRQAVARRYQQLLATDEHGWTRIKENIRVHRCESVARVHPCKSVAKPLPWPKADRTSVFAQYTILVDDREALQPKLTDAGIPTAVHYPIPLNEQPAYAHLCCPDCTPVARNIARQVMSLPMHADLTEAEQTRIATMLYHEVELLSPA